MPGKMDRKLIEKRCVYCGLLFETKNSRTKYCSEDCAKAAKIANYNKKHKSLVLKEHIRRTADKSISEVMRELAEYNRTHHKSLTYGQYVALEGKQ